MRVSPAAGAAWIAYPLRVNPTASLDAWQAAGRSFSHGGHALAYWEGGSGEPLLLIHGFPTASWDWSAVWPALARRFQLVAMDMLGFGFSSKPRPHVYSIAEQANLQEALLAQLGIERCHVLAHDYGGHYPQVETPAEVVKAFLAFHDARVR